VTRTYHLLAPPVTVTLSYPGGRVDFTAYMRNNGDFRKVWNQLKHFMLLDVGDDA
jgi:hypothetical protein